MKTIGIKLADGSFYPVLEDNTPSEKKLELTTAHNNQTKVMVDLYRSANCTMEDAEYVDSLQIENLVARPNGETDIKFTISLDEDNQLSAKIVDSETGNESKTTITLVSRTLEERLVTDEYDINDTEESDDKGTKAAVAGAVAAGGLLAAAAALRNKKEEDPVIEPENNTTIDETEVPMGDEIALDEAPVDTTEVAEETSDSLPDMDFDLPDETDSNSDDAVVDPVEGGETTSDETTTDAGEAADDFGDMNFDLPDGSENTITESDETITTDEASDDLADMSFDLPEETESTSDETITTDETFADDSTFSADETISNDDTFSADETISDDETFSADETITDDDMFSTEDSSDISDSTDNSETLPDMDFDLPDNTTETQTPEMPDDFFNTNDFDQIEEPVKEPTFDTESPAAAGLNFDGLYDEETERGTPAQSDEDDVKKKTKVPVIICIICAIICIIATLLILFIIPSKYNLISKKNAKAPVVTEAPAPEPVPEPVAEPEPPVPQAKEDEIVIIEKAEEVVPKQPPVAEEKPKNITYKIKWGDTLWDIADTYYKNPWRYKYIARYNGIKNPDYIISGTKIIIPAE